MTHKDRQILRCACGGWTGRRENGRDKSRNKLAQQAHSDPFFTSRRLISWWLREMLSVNISMRSRHPPGPRASNVCWDKGLTFSTKNIQKLESQLIYMSIYYNSCWHTALLTAVSMEALGMFLLLHCSRTWARFIFMSGLAPPSTGEGRN